MGAKATEQPWPASSPATAQAVSAELALLQEQSLDALRLQWRNRWGRLPPSHIPRGLLLRVMAYRLQAEQYGDLDRETRRVLSDRAEASKEGSPKQPRTVTTPVEPRLVLRPGTLLTREWRGRLERVMVLEEGFAWSGKTYPSLSATAFAITGTKWNGHRFFGLLDRQDGSRRHADGPPPHARPENGELPL